MILEDFLLWGYVGRVVCLLLGFLVPVEWKIMSYVRTLPCIGQ